MGGGVLSLCAYETVGDCGPVHGAYDGVLV